MHGPFTYEALPPEDIRFVPLKQTREFNAKELMQYYLDNDQKLKKFVPIIHSSVVYPVIYDANRTVLSLPPIINGQHSAISLETKDVFIECTATDLTKAKVVLNTVVTMFSEYCSRPFEVEPVEVTDAFGNKTVYPDLSCRRLDLTTTYVNSLLGVSLPGPDIATLLNKMQVSATLGPDGTALSVSVGARNERRLVAVYCAKESGFEVVHGLLNRVMEVLTAFELPYPVSALELNIEPFVFDQFYQSKLEPLSN
eukprot:XP_001699120.1 predicted protein [Chlamydomonas reinhardtii]